MMNFNPSMVGHVKHGIDTALTKLGRQHAALRNQADIEDLSQIVWCRVLTGYNPAKAAYTAKVRKATADLNLAGDKYAHKIEHDGSVLAGFAYRITYNVALDFLRGRKSVANSDRNALSIDAEIENEHSVTSLHDITPCAQPSAFDMIQHDQESAYLTCALDALTVAQKQTLAREVAGESLNGAQRVAKTRALNAVTANMPKSLRSGKRSKAYGRKKIK